MRTTYTKDNVETHNEHYGKVRPAVNVKVYHFPSSYKIMDKFNCSEEVASKAYEFAFQGACKMFWEEAQGIADDVYGKNNVKVYSEGRSGGWCVVDGLDNVENWTLMQLNKWHLFETRVKASVKFLTSESVIFENLEFFLSSAKGDN
jgi:hypothetical protein